MKHKKYILIQIIHLLLGGVNFIYGQICFIQTDTFSVDTQPGSIISADFNSDGKMDMATTNANSNNVSIILGTGTGSFNLPVYFSVGNSPQGICVADFNEDGKIDLATANLGSNNVSVLLGNGLGSFGSPINHSTYNYTQSLCSSDFNSDGKVDIAVATYNPPSSISVLFGDGTGGFSSSVNLALGFMGGAATITSADFNGDGKADLASVNGGTYQMSVLMGNGTGGFSSPVNYSASNTLSSIIHADFNGDGKADLASTLNNSAVIYMNNGTGSFAAPIYANSSPTTTVQAVSLCSADFDKDGKMDIATANYPNSISILGGLGTGNFSAPIVYPVNSHIVNDYPASIVSVNFNGDSLPDIATGNAWSYDVAIFLNCSAVGIDQYTSDQQITIYPNPINEVMNVALRQDIENCWELKITDILGNEIKSDKFEGKSNQKVDISILQSGIYFVNVKTTEGIITKKIIVQH